MPAETFLAVIYAKNDLRIGTGIALTPGSMIMIRTYRLENAFPIMVLICI